MIFAQRKRIGLAFSLLRRELPLTLLFVVDLLFRYAAATVDDVASPSDSNSGRAAFCYTHGGVIFLQFGILLYFYSFRLPMLYPRGCNILQFGILIYFIPFGLLNFFGVLSSLFLSNQIHAGVISLFDFSTLISYHHSRYTVFLSTFVSDFTRPFKCGRVTHSRIYPVLNPVLTSYLGTSSTYVPCQTSRSCTLRTLI